MNLPSTFSRPSAAYRPVPFWWWVGEPLDRKRLLWQLDQLRLRGVLGAVIGYNHHPDGSNNPGEPPVFSPAWWELLRWLAAECRARGMVLGFQDYTLINPLLAAIGRDFPEMAGAGLHEAHAEVGPGEQADLSVPAGGRALVAMAFPRGDAGPGSGPPLALTGWVRENRLAWKPASGRWIVSLVWTRPGPFDPMHRDSGRRVIERFYAQFERECPGEVGATLKIFFQDELDFGIRMPMWSDRLPEAFVAAKGYELMERLPALWHDLGPATAKLRVDYADVVTRLMEASYFIPIFEWHERRGTLLGHDNCGRGAIGTGRSFYGDYFRAMRWYSAPGTDDPQVQGPRAFRGLKVNSSIAHLYHRPRVWVECFHSSGWGATPAQIVGALNEDFLLGANFINLHGLYYTTFGSWWEWAPPDFHFRQPYWLHLGPLNDYLARLSELLSQGVHVCDVAILYPITAIEGGLNLASDGGEPVSGSLSERQRGEAGEAIDPAEAGAFRLGRALVEAGSDFDFVDFESIDRAVVSGGALEVEGESYRVLVLPMMSCMRFTNLRKAREFYRGGGWVVAWGCLPSASDRIGAGDAEVTAIVEEIFGALPARHGEGTANAAGGRGVFLGGEVGEAVRAVRSRGTPDFESGGARWQALHRRVGGRHLYFVRNPLDRPAVAEATFRAQGAAEIWNAWTGSVVPLGANAATGAGTRLTLTLGPREAQLVVFDPSRPSLVVGASPAAIEVVATLPEAGWAFELAPTLDNRHGDFRLPGSAGFLGAEARTFRYREERAAAEDQFRPDLDDSGWDSVTFSHGQQFWLLGPLPPEEREAGPEDELRRLRRVDPERPVVVSGREYFWRPYEFSREWGIERDPFLTDWSSGPHGLKKEVPDEFIDLHCDRPGSIWYLWSALESAEGGEAPLVAGSRSAFRVWLQGQSVLERPKALPAGRYPAWNLPYYHSEPERASVRLAAGDNALLVRLEQPSDQRVRAYVAIDAPRVQTRPALRWFAASSGWNFNPRPRDRAHSGWYRFLSPPGLKSLRFAVRGDLTVWANGAPLPVDLPATDAAGVSHYDARVPEPEAKPVVVAFRVRQAPDSFGGDSMSGPVLLDCGAGTIALGDWSAQGLATYSGAAWYRRAFDLDENGDGALLLDLGEVRVTAEIWLNGARVGVLLAPPWRIDVTAAVQSGTNRLEVLVANTLANHYSVGVPTPYVFPEQTVSGLLGPVRLLRARPAAR